MNRKRQPLTVAEDSYVTAGATFSRPDFFRKNTDGVGVVVMFSVAAALLFSTNLGIYSVAWISILSGAGTSFLLSFLSYRRVSSRLKNTEVLSTEGARAIEKLRRVRSKVEDKVLKMKAPKPELFNAVSALLQVENALIKEFGKLELKQKEEAELIDELMATPLAKAEELLKEVKLILLREREEEVRQVKKNLDDSPALGEALTQMDAGLDELRLRNQSEELAWNDLKDWR